MATIQLVLQAINDASRNINEVADSLEVVSAAQEQAAETARALSEAELAAAQAAVDAISAYSELRASADELAVASVNAREATIGLASGVGEASRGAVTAAYAYARLSDEQLTAANTAVAAAAAERAAAEAVGQVGAESAAAAAGMRFLTEAELDAAQAALRTQFAVRSLGEAQIGAANSALAYREALVSAGDAETQVAVKAGAAAAAITALNARMAASGTQARNAITGFNLWGGFLTALTQKVPLWGGLLDGLLPKVLTQVTAWHLWGDAVIEVVAVWSGAAIALGAWGAAASDAINNVQRHFTDLHTVGDAFNATIPPMTSNLEKMHDAVQPQVYSLLGDALTVLKAKGNELNTVIMQTGQVLQQLGARTALALQSSSASTFLKNSVNDVRLLGAAFGNLFGIFGNLIRMNQGWATALLQVGTDILGVTEHVTGLIIPLGQLLVLGHGFVLWVGLAVTVALKFGTMIAGWGASIKNTAVGLVELTRVLGAFIEQEGVMAALNLVDPLAWVGIAVGALVGLVFWINSSKTAVEQFGDSVVKAAQNASTLTGAIGVLQTGVAQSADKVTAAQTHLNTVMAQTSSQVTGSATRFGQYSGAVSAAEGNLNDAVTVHAQLSSTLGTVDTRVGLLGKQYGGTTAALGLLSAAGVTNTQMMDKSGNAWAMIKQQVLAAQQGMQAMGLQAGALGNSLQVLDKQATDGFQAMQKVNQGWDAQTSAMTGAMTSFDTVAQGFNTLSSGSVKFTDSLGRLRVTGINFVKSGIDQLTPSGIALNQAFAQQVGNTNSLADSWRSAGIASNLFKSGLAAAIAPLEKYAAGSQDATAQLVGLAQEAGYQGPMSLDALNKFLGITSGQLQNTAGDMKTMQQVAQQATQQEALLTSAMQAQGSYIAGQLIGDINNAILKYNGVAQAATAYGNAVAQSGRQSDAAQSARQTLIKDLIASGKAAGDTTAQIAAMISKVLGIPAKAALQIVMTGTGLYTITGKAVSASQGAGGSGNAAGGLARGGFIRGGTPGKDSVLGMLMPGEVVVPVPMVNAGAVDHLRGRLPGFAGGGLVLGGDTSVLTGGRAVSDYNAFRATMVTAMVRSMRRSEGIPGYADGGAVGDDAAAALDQGLNALTLAISSGQPFGNAGQQQAVGLPGSVAAPYNPVTGALAQLRQSLQSDLTAQTQLRLAIQAQTAAIASQTAATTTSTTATTAAAAATTAAAAKPKPAPKLTPVQVDQKKIAADKANAATLTARIKAVEQAIKDTPAKDKSALATEEKLLKTLQSALSKQDKTTGSDEKKLTAEIIKDNKTVVAAMTKQIAAITKLLGSGAAATGPSGLWSKLAADEKALAAAQSAIKATTSGASGGSTAAKAVATSSASAAASLTSIKAQVSAAYTKLDSLEATAKSIDAQYKAATKGTTAKSQLYTQLQTAFKAVDAQWKTIDALLAAEKKAKAAAPASGGGGGSTGGSYTGVVVDRKAESELASILAELKAENALLRQACGDLAKIRAEADPAAQAKAIGPAVASALNASGRTAAAAKTTKRG